MMKNEAYSQYCLNECVVFQYQICGLKLWPYVVWRYVLGFSKLPVDLHFTLTFNILTLTILQMYLHNDHGTKFC